MEKKMSTIRELNNEFKVARAMNKAGQIIEAAQVALSVQRRAARSRSRFAPELAMDAHCLAATARGRLDNAGITDHAARSEAGRIAQASYFILHGTK
jgi:hypothetical protein